MKKIVITVYLSRLKNSWNGDHEIKTQMLNIPQRNNVQNIE